MPAQVLSQFVSEKLDFISLPKVNFGKFWVLGFVSISLLLVSYIFQISKVTEASFLISSYERDIGALSRHNKTLEINLSKGNSLTDLEVSLEGLNYEKVSRVHYIKVMDTGVAVKP